MKTESPGRHPAHATKASLLRRLRRHKPQRPKTHKLKCEVLSCLSPLDESPTTLGQPLGIIIVKACSHCEKHNPPRMTVFQKSTSTTFSALVSQMTLLAAAAAG